MVVSAVWRIVGYGRITTKAARSIIVQMIEAPSTETRSQSRPGAPEAGGVGKTAEERALWRIVGVSLFSGGAAPVLVVRGGVYTVLPVS